MSLTQICPGAEGFSVFARMFGDSARAVEQAGFNLKQDVFVFEAIMLSDEGLTLSDVVKVISPDKPRNFPPAQLVLRRLVDIGYVRKIDATKHYVPTASAKKKFKI